MADLFGLIGKNIGYSRSPELFTAFFEQYGLYAEYRLFDLAGVTEIKKLIDQPALKGFNVTIPYKKAVIPFLDNLDTGAEQTGAVNTVKIVNGKLYGYNTDIYGFEQALLEFLQPHHRNAIILGDGATARTVRYVLDKLNINYLNVSRSKKKHTITYDELTPAIIGTHKLIINTTPLGNLNHPGQKPSIPYENIKAEHYLFDLNYNPPVTPFLEEGIKRNAVTRNGLKMLELQAVKALQIWYPRTGIINTEK
jgi:shikimate dehydrogenase